MSTRKVRLGNQTSGIIPSNQLATGGADADEVPIADGSNSQVWGAQSGGGGGSVCDHEHTSEEFVAEGGSPETFDLAHTPMWVSRVYVEGLRIAPSAVGGSGTSVEVDTTIGDVVVIDYEVECGTAPAGALAFPGASFYHDFFGYDVNEVASFVTTGPAVIIIDITTGIVGDSSYIWPTDDTTVAGRMVLPPILGWSGNVDANGATPGRYVFVAPSAGTWRILANDDGAYDPGLTGDGTYAVLYPTGTPTDVLTFPGADGSGSGFGNILASDAIAVPSVVFVTTASDLPADYRFGVAGAVTGQNGYIQFDTGQPFPAGTYPVVLDLAETGIDVSAYDQTTGGTTYDGGLTGSGSYEIVPLP